MKKITTSVGKFGPYRNVEVLEDRYRVDGPADLPFTVIGQGVISDVVDGDFPPPVFITIVEAEPAPTKEQLLAELQALTAKINALR
jgi:hypothetical protein